MFVADGLLLPIAVLHYLVLEMLFAVQFDGQDRNNKELINVATSRARDKLIVLSSRQHLERLHQNVQIDKGLFLPALGQDAEFGMIILTVVKPDDILMAPVMVVQLLAGIWGKRRIS